jgi:hypothetical protein
VAYHLFPYYCERGLLLETKGGELQSVRIEKIDDQEKGGAHGLESNLWAMEASER